MTVILVLKHLEKNSLPLHIQIVSVTLLSTYIKIT